VRRVLEIAPNAADAHYVLGVCLRVLSNAGLIEHRSAGTRNLYLLAPGGMAVAQQWLTRTWDTVLAAYALYRLIEGAAPASALDTKYAPATERWSRSE